MAVWPPAPAAPRASSPAATATSPATTSPTPWPCAPRSGPTASRSAPTVASSTASAAGDPTGRTAWVTDGPTLCRRLATLIPPRRSHQVRYHGVFASAHRLRDRVLPLPLPDDDAAAPVTASMLARRLDWAALLERVFGADVTTCPRCGDPLRVLAFLTAPDVTARILDHLGLPAAVPSIAPARGPPPDDLEPELPLADF